MYMEVTFFEAITTNMQIGKDFLVFKYRLLVNKKFQNIHYFY